MNYMYLSDLETYRKGQFCGLSGLLKSMGITTLAFQAARKINDSSWTAAASRESPARPMSH